MDNVPILKKCCFCMPLRCGLLTWGYLKLAGTLSGLGYYILVVWILSINNQMSDVYSVAITCLIGVTLVTEIVLHIIFIIGAHKKYVKLLKVYYCYAVFMWVVSIKLAIVAIVLLILTLSNHPSTKYVETEFITLFVCSFIFSIIVQTFLVLSLRSEIIKIRSNCPYRFVKNDNDPEGTISSLKNEDDTSMDTTTVRIL